MEHPIMLLIIVGIIVALYILNGDNESNEDGRGFGDIIMAILLITVHIIFPIIGVIMLIIGKL